MEFLGKKVRICLTGGGTLEGFVNNIDRNRGKISLEKVVNAESGKKMLGLQHLFAEDIESIEVLEAVTRTAATKVQEPEAGRQRGQGILRSKYVPEHLTRLKVLDPSSLVLRNQQAPHDGLNSSGDSGTDSDGSAGYNGVTIIGKLNKLFHEAIEYISRHQVIAMSLEGVSIGRNGKLCWILVATPDHVFMFDMLRLGEDCFQNGLKDILTNDNILKVLHDCRLVADMLYHQYGIDMVNVYDTQVASVFVFRLGHHNDWPRYVDGLAPCLVQHLDLSPEDVNWAVVRERCRQEDEEVWAERPPKKYVIEAGIKNVIHLLELRSVLNEKMMEEFVAGVNIYLSHVKDASRTDATKYQSNSHLLPQSFQYIHKFMAVYSGRNPNHVPYSYTTDNNGFRENCTGIAQPDVVFSRDSLWHSTNMGPEKARSRSRGRRRYVDYFLSESKQKEAAASAETPRPIQPGQFDDVSLTKNVNEDHGTDKVCETNSSHGNTCITAQQNLTDLMLHTANHSDSENVQPISAVPSCSIGIEPSASREVSSAVDSDTNELTGSRLMRALIKDQTPHGITSDDLVFKPAGVQVSRNMIKETTSRERRTACQYEATKSPRAPSQFRGQRPSYTGRENNPSETSSRREIPKYTSFLKSGALSQQEIDFARKNYPSSSRPDTGKVSSDSSKNPQAASSDQSGQNKNYSHDKGQNVVDDDIENRSHEPVERVFYFADDRTASNVKTFDENVDISAKYSFQGSDSEPEPMHAGNVACRTTQSQGLVFQSSISTEKPSPTKANKLQLMMDAIKSQKDAFSK